MTKVSADLVLKNGKIFLGQGLGFAPALAVWGGKVLASGADREIADLIGADTALSIWPGARRSRG